MEPELAADARDSLERGRSSAGLPTLVSRTIADGTRTQALGARTFAHLLAHLDGIVTVTEVEIAAAVRLAAERSRLVVEPSGALSSRRMTFHAEEIGLDRLDGASWPWSAAATSTRTPTASTSRRRSRPRAEARPPTT